MGNTIIVVEHDRETIESSDYMIDLGPGAGIHGGQICSNGITKKLLKEKNGSP
jgi:excinuclease ABC subunit A